MVRRNKLPITIAFLVCFLVITLTFNANNSSMLITSEDAVRRVIVLDAGHGAYVVGVV